MKKICNNCNTKYETDDNERKICYPCYQIITNRRPIKRDEIVLDCDDRENGDLALRQIGMMFSAEGYCLEVWKAEGQKSYHIHIKDIPHISELSKEQNKLYKELLIKKYLNKVVDILGYKPVYFDKIDFNLCQPDHLVAEENKPHDKYKTKKELLAIINEGYKNFCEPDIYEQVISKSETKSYNPNIKCSGITAKIMQKISIIQIAKEFGIEVNSKGFAVCPFHADGNPSLKFYNDEGRFICFGCRTMGNIVYFYALMKKLKGGEQTR